MSHKKTALLVDDEPELIASRLHEMLGADEWDLEIASSAAAAVSKIEGCSPLNLIVLDYQLDGEQRGDYLLARIREQGDRGEPPVDTCTPIVPLSSKDGFLSRDETRFGLVHYFLDKRQLFSGIEEHQRQLRRELRSGIVSHMQQLCTPRVNSETGLLRTVLTHRPAEEIEHIDPDRIGWYLFESRISLELAQKEHDDFTALLRRHGQRPIILDTMILFVDILREASPGDRRSIVESCLLGPELRGVSQRFSAAGIVLSPTLDAHLDQLCALENGDLAARVFRGVNLADLAAPERTPQWYTRHERQVVAPVPNSYFTRDPACVLGESLVFSRMFWPVRRREPYILREIVRRHPYFARAAEKVVDLLDDDRVYTIEGGDAMVLGEGEFVIAASERTSPAAIREVAKHLFERKLADRVIQPTIPAKRACIHLDTVCSLVGTAAFVAHPEALNAASNAVVWVPGKQGPVEKPLGMSFLDYLEKEKKRTLIKTAGGGPRALLEQWDDATNVFMVSPDRVVAYNRNVDTNKAIADCADARVEVFDGSNLVMGRGGPRCMTMPLQRVG